MLITINKSRTPNNSQFSEINHYHVNPEKATSMQMNMIFCIEKKSHTYK